jgi:phosphoribosylamine--glycine ligase
MASGGYPGHYEKGKVITGLDAAGALKDVVVFHAGTALREGKTVTAGGRVLGVTALGADIRGAIARAYEAVKLIRFEGAHYRTDIGARALQREA